MTSRPGAFIGQFRASFHTRAGVSLWLPAAVALTFFIFLQLDPFGIDSASDARSEQATLRIVSPFYNPSRQVAVVLIDDDYLRARGIGWPLRFAEQGRLLRQIASVGPAVVLVDFVYPHLHGDAASGGSPDDIKSLTDPIRASPVPIVFTAMAREPEALPKDFSFCADEVRHSQPSFDILDADSMSPELLKLVRADKTRYQTGYVRWVGCGNRYPLLLGGDVNAPTPVFAAYRAFCASSAGQGRCAHRDPSAHAEDYVHPMIVRAGAFPPADQAFAYSESVCQKAAGANGEVSPWRRLRTAFQQLALGVFKDPRGERNLEVSLPCPALTVIPLSLLQNASRREWEELLQNRAVVLGANISGIPDFINSPVHGQIPGAVWHGMALDNLVSLGTGYLAERHHRLQQIADVFLVLLFAYTFPFVLSLLEHRRVLRGRAYVSFALWVALAVVYWVYDDPLAALICALIGIGFDLTKPSSSATYLVGIAAAALGSVFFLARGWPPANWLGLVFVVVAFGHTLKPYYHASERKEFPASLSVLRAVFQWLVVRTARRPPVSPRAASGE